MNRPPRHNLNPLAPRRPRDTRPSAHRRGYDARWNKVRLLQLSREPLCRECKAAGITTIAKHVDHVQTIASGADPYDMDNLQSLCVPCHSRKTAREDGGFGRRRLTAPGSIATAVTPTPSPARAATGAGQPVPPRPQPAGGGGSESSGGG